LGDIKRVSLLFFFENKRVSLRFILSAVTHSLSKNKRLERKTKKEIKRSPLMQRERNISKLNALINIYT
jgi:hypothetical protein